MTQADFEIRPLPLRRALVLGLGVAALLSGLAPRTLSATQDDYEPSGSYSYVRTLDGSAELDGANGEREEITLNQPVLPGDRIAVHRSSRLEIVLADGNLLRLDAGGELIFESIAASYGDTSSQTHLRLLTGTLQLVVEQASARHELPRIETENSTVHIQQPGRYLIVVEDGQWTQVVVREGSAEVATQRGSLIVREDEQALVEGDRWPRASVEPAMAVGALERWGDGLEEEAREASFDEIDGSLRYGSSSMRGHGSWVHVSGSRRAWRPTVDAAWRPYREGFWRYTPGGYTWVSTEPWGWVPYHYGTWDYVPGHGWVWFPDRGFAPAWVYWYWGPDYVGWCPTGYYSRHYQDRYGHGSRFGVYGWAGGDRGLFAHWSFIPSHDFGRHFGHQSGRFGQARRTRPAYLRGSDLAGGRLADGVITTDTSGLAPHLTEKPAEVVRVLQTRPGLRGELPNVTEFVARRELTPEVEAQILRPKPALAQPTNQGTGSGRPAVVPVEERPTRQERPGAGAVRPRPVVPAPQGWSQDRSPETKPQAGGSASSRPPGSPAPVIVRRPAEYDGRDPQGRDPQVRGERAPTLRPVSPSPAPERPVRVTPAPSSRPEVAPAKPPQPRPLPPSPSIQPKPESKPQGSDGSKKAGATRPPRPPSAG